MLNRLNRWVPSTDFLGVLTSHTSCESRSKKKESLKRKEPADGPPTSSISQNVLLHHLHAAAAAAELALARDRAAPAAAVRLPSAPLAPPLPATLCLSTLTAAARAYESKLIKNQLFLIFSLIKKIPKI